MKFNISSMPAYYLGAVFTKGILIYTSRLCERTITIIFLRIVAKRIVICPRSGNIQFLSENQAVLLLRN